MNRAPAPANQPRLDGPLVATIIIALGLVVGAGLMAGPAFAGSCAEDISRLNTAMKDQYEPFSWSNMFYCAVARGSELRKDALVSHTQMKAIASDVSWAMRLERIGDEQDCKAKLVTAKRLLKTY